MKFRASLAIFTVAAFCFTSCQKDDVPFQEEEKPLNKIKTYTETVHSSTLGNIEATFDLKYNADNRLISAISQQDPGNKFLWTYNDANKLELDIYSNNAVIIHENAFLIENKFLDSTIQFNLEEGDTTTEKYFYNADRLLTSINYYDHSIVTGASIFDQTIYTYDDNNNVLTEKTSNNLITYEYTEVIPNTIDIFPMFFLPQKQLPSKAIYNTGGPDELVGVHTYTFDDKQRLTSDKMTITGGDEIIKSYTYY